ncbi:MAG: hypothetical protein WAL90_01120, partial [Desulfobacterales bacterium]
TSFRVTMFPVCSPSSAIASVNAAVSLFRVCGSNREAHACTSIGERPRRGTTKSTSLPDGSSGVGPH